MSSEHTHHNPLHPHRHEEAEHEAPSADEFVEIRESEDPADPDRPIVREDEHYERLSETRLFPTERVLDPRLDPPQP